MSRRKPAAVGFIAVSLIVTSIIRPASGQDLDADKANLESYRISKLKVGARDWPQWGGSPLRNNTPVGTNIPTHWDIETSKNIKWSAKLGSQNWGSPVVANGKIFIG